MNLRLAAVLMLALSMLEALGPFDGKTGMLIRDGYTLLGENKYNEALAKFREAAQLDPKCSFATSGQAMAFCKAIPLSDEAHAKEYRELAETLAREALELNDMDAMATMVLKQLSGGTLESQHTPSPEALKCFEGAEGCFAAKAFDEAVTLYRKALEQDPGYTDAALYLGDCYFAQGKMSEAEPWFRKATELEPLYGRAWRFLFDCYGVLNEPQKAGQAALSGVAAEPDNLNAWARLRQSRKVRGEKELERFKWPANPVRVSEKDGKSEIHLIMENLNDKDDIADGSFHTLYGITLGGSQVGVGKKKTLSLFEQERMALELGLEGLKNTLSDGQKRIKDPALSKLLEFGKAGHLETAIFLLHFREAFRPDFEAWKKANPTGIAVFLDLFPLRP